MRKPFSGWRSACLALFALACQPGLAQQKTLAPGEFTAWLPVSEAERAQQAPLVEKDAGAEILLWRVHVVDELLGDNRSFQRVFYNYIRLKVFDDRGKEKSATVDLRYRAPGGVLDVSGRTIKADGTIVELDRKTVYQRTLERVAGSKESVVSFAMPAVEKGSILEYRWKQTEDDNRFRYMRLEFQRDLPVQKVTYFVKPLANFFINEEQYLAPFNCKPTALKGENDGYVSTTLENVPGRRQEVFSPSDPNIQPWALLYYRQGGMKDANRYWEEQAKQVYKEYREDLKNDAETKNAATVAASGVSDESQRIVALAAFVRKAVRNIADPTVTAAEREAFFQKLPKDRRRTSTEILKSGLGMAREINLVFAALAAQVGFDVRPALVADRGELFFNPKLSDRYFLDHEAIAVRSGASWKVIDLGDHDISPGMLPWREEGMMALVADAKGPVFIQVPVTPPDQSSEVRSAQLELSREGALTGDVTETYTGHQGEDTRSQYAAKSEAQRVEIFHDRVVRMFPDADVTEIKFDNAADASKPLVIRYHLDAPRFAQVTGKRILLQPNAFRRGQASPFSAAERRNPVEFPYGWKETDNLSIALPGGFVLDNADSPGSINFGKPGSYDLKIELVKGDRPTLNYVRTFVFGNEAAISFEASAYGSLKKVFDVVQTHDAHTISLKEN